MTPTAAHWIEASPPPTATSIVKMVIRVVIAMAPYNKIERRLIFSTVKLRGTHPSAKKTFKTPERRETRDGFAIVDRITLPASH